MNRILLIIFILASLNLSAQTQPRLVLPVGHLGGVTKMVSSPNQQLILTQDQNSDLIIIDGKKLNELNRQHFEGKKLESSTFINDSSVISICDDTLLLVWNFYFNEIDFMKIEVSASRIYSRPFLHLIDSKSRLHSLNIKNGIAFLTQISDHKCKDAYLIDENKFLLYSDKKIIVEDKEMNLSFSKHFNENISCISHNDWNGNILLGFDDGKIQELDSNLNFVHSFVPISDLISSLAYLNDSTIISGSYDFSLVVQDKKQIRQGVLLNDWIVGIISQNDEIKVATWSGMINSYKIDSTLIFTNEHKVFLKKASFFKQIGGDLYGSNNDGSIDVFNIVDKKKKNSISISKLPILGFDVNYNQSLIVTWDEEKILVVDLQKRQITQTIRRENIASVLFIPNKSSFIFCTSDFLYRFTNKNLDSVELKDVWSLANHGVNIISSGYDKVIISNENKNTILSFPGVGQIWVSEINANFLVLGTSDGKLILSDTLGHKIFSKKYPEGINGIKFIDMSNIIINCQDGNLYQLNLKNKKSEIIASSGQEYGSWDFLLNSKTNKIIFPNSRRWNYHMDIDLLDGNKQWEVEKKLSDVDGEVVCVSASNRSIALNHLDSNEVIFLVSDGSLKLWNYDNNDNKTITNLGFQYNDFLISKVKPSLIKNSFLKSGLLKVISNFNDTVTFITLKNGDWLVYDKAYRFDGTKGAIEKLYFTCGLEVVELEQVKDSLYVPNLIQRFLNGENLDHLPKLSELNICGVTPLVELLENDKSGKQGYRIIPRSGGVGDLDVYINGVVRLSTNGKNITNKDNKGNYLLYLEKELLDLYQNPREELKLKVIAKTANNSISSRGVVIDIESDEKTSFKKPALHAIMIGVDDYKGDGLDLNYAAKDANDLHIVLQKSAQKFFNIDDTSRVHFYNLTVNRFGVNGNEKIKGITPDRTNIIKTIVQIEKTSKPEDILLLFFAGHGEIVDKDQLLLLTSESSRDDFKGLQMRELLELLNKVPAGKRVLILDACHSGAAINNLDMAQITGKRDVKDAERQSQRLKELDKLASKSGFAIITASSSDQKALELPQYEHGLMTYALLNSMLNNKNALDEDNNLQLEKWFMATEEEVRKLNANQSAERMVSINFTLGKLDDEVRASIVLKEIPTIYVENVLNKNTFKDDLKIKSMLTSAFQEMSRGSDSKIIIADFPNSIKVNILYEELGEDIQASVLLFNENFEEKFKVISKENNLGLFVQEIMNQIRTKIQK